MSEHLLRDIAVDAPAHPGLSRRLSAEAVGSFFLFAGVIGSGIMAERLAGGNIAIALLGNSLATGAILFVIIMMFLPISGAHFNPAVSLVAAVRRELPPREAALYMAAQLGGGMIGVVAAHAMFDLALFQISQHARAGAGQWLGEGVATFGLILTILGAVRFRPDWVAPAVGLYIAAGYWFTSSTSFANPAITVARAFSDTFAGIALAHVPAFLAAQVAGALAAAWLGGYLFDGHDPGTQAR